MPGTTPDWEFPYPLVGESPAGHTQMQDLAMALDGAMSYLGAWGAYTPALTGVLALGNGTIEGRWTLIGETVIGMARATLGTTSTVTGSGYVAFSLPVPPAAQGNLMSTLSVSYDTSADIVAMGLGFLTGSTVRCLAWAGANGQPQAITSTFPFAWAATDAIQAPFFYRAA